jgi:histidinol-phosphate aminotransferase
VCANINDVEIVSVPLIVDNGAFQLDVANIKKSIDGVKIIFLCSPGNPTGTLLNLEDIQSILEFENYKGIVLVDEAYIDFCPNHSSVVSWIDKYPNLIVIQTLSKSFGLAGIRYFY